MPNGVTYSDEKTNNKVIRALMGNNDLDFQQVMDAVERLQEAGILFREEPETRVLGPRKSRDGSESQENNETQDNRYKAGESYSTTEDVPRDSPPLQGQSAKDPQALGAE